MPRSSDGDPLFTGGVHAEGDALVGLAGYLTNRERWPSGLPSLLAAYRERGPDFVGELEGAYVLVVVEGSELLLARDGAGVRTAYYAHVGPRLVFAVEPKGVLALPGFSRRIRPAAIAQYFSFSFVPGDGTMLEGLHELPCGSLLHCSPRGDRIDRHFAFEENADEARDDSDDWAQAARTAIERAVSVRLPKGEDVGVLLSGGIDSSIVAAEVARQSERKISTYSLHFGREEPNELGFARMVADRIGSRHHEIGLRPSDFLPTLREMAWHLDDPIGDPVTVPNFIVSQRVSTHTRWLFNGEGGDPVFGGPKNLPMLLHHWYGVPREAGFRERAYLSSFRRGYDFLGDLLTPEVLSQVDPERDLEGVVRPFLATSRPSLFLDKLMAMNIRLKGAHLILPKVDRMSGASAITTFSPLYDERLVRLSFQMPPRMKLQRGIEKFVLKQAYRGILPDAVIDRPKSGMHVPIGSWLRGDLFRYTRSLLRPRRLRRDGIFRSEVVQELLKSAKRGRSQRSALLVWMVLTFELWREVVLGENAT